MYALCMHFDFLLKRISRYKFSVRDKVTTCSTRLHVTRSDRNMNQEKSRAKNGNGQNSAFIADGNYWVNNHAHVFRPKKELLNDTFVVTILNQMDLMPFITGVTVPKLNQERMRSIEIPVPPIDVQLEIAAEVDLERSQVESAMKLIETYEAKTQAVIAKLWSE